MSGADRHSSDNRPVQRDIATSSQSLDLPYPFYLDTTSAFTVVGKVTNVWPCPEEIVDLYRRSVVSLLPSLAQALVWGRVRTALVAGAGA